MENMGLFIRGIVEGRTKRLVGDKNKEVVKYKLKAGEKTFFIDAWSPEQYLSVGDDVEIPVYVNTYTNKKGLTSINFVEITKEQEMQGEEF